MSSPNAYAAQIDEFGIVRQVIVIPFCGDTDEQVTDYCNGIGLSGTWLDTSYLGNRRRRFAGIGMKYDAERDAFITDQPFPSWTLDALGDWQPPSPMPTDGDSYAWNEFTQEWQAVTD